MNNIEWFLERGLRNVEYQQDTIIKIGKSIESERETILGACPSAGKTIMTICSLNNYFKNHPDHKVMILTHGTTVLRTQFHDVLEELNRIKPLGFTFNLADSFSNYNETKQVNICLPQSFQKHKVPHFDLLVIDEAHHFYSADMVQRIIKNSGCSKLLLLTGTPSSFIYDNKKIIPVCVSTIYDANMISDIYVEIATSSYRFDIIRDYRNDELKTEVIFKQSETKKTLDDLLEKIIERLKSFKDNEICNFTGWLPTLLKLQKTMFACKSQSQAKQVQKYFEKKGIKSIISISDIDYDSSAIQEFKDCEDCLVLIVVGRGVLGFDYPELINVVDMTTSQNIDRIFQLLCRVLRKHPKGNRKFFFKIAPNTMSDYYKYIMTGVLSLTDEYFFTHFNGKNFNDMKIPVRRTTPGLPNDREGEHRPRVDTPKFTPIVFEGLPAIELFKDVFHKKDSLLHTYAFTTVRNVKAIFSNNKPIGYWNLENCKESAQKYETRTEWKNNQPVAYQYSRENGWMEECCSHMKEVIKPNGYWTLEKCKEDALNYDTITDWMENSGSAYNKAITSGWKEECTKHMIRGVKPNGYWTLERCKEDALKYNTRTEWQYQKGSSYNSARRNGWVDECCKHMEMLIRPDGYWTLEACIEEALKYNTISKWQKNGKSSYIISHKNGWMKECTGHMKELMKPDGYWTLERCKESASKYMSRMEWSRNVGGAYAIARKNGWLDECCKHMIQFSKPRNYWTLEKCKEDALKYKTQTEWRKTKGSSYYAADRNGWIKECTKHMISSKRKPDGYWNIKENVFNAVRECFSFSELYSKYKGIQEPIRKNGWYDEVKEYYNSLEK